MNLKPLFLFYLLFILLSCSSTEEAILIGEKDLTAVTHTFYNYVYPDKPATRTYTTYYTFRAHKITDIRTTIYHYFQEEPQRNYTTYEDSFFSYDSNDRIIQVQLERWTSNDTTIHQSKYDFNYDENNRIKELRHTDNTGELSNRTHFIYNREHIVRTFEYYQNGNKMFYNEAILFLDRHQRIARQSVKGPIFEDLDSNAFTPTTQAATFDLDNNVYQTYSDGNPSLEYNYTEIKIPIDLPDLNLPFFSAIPYDFLLGEFDQIITSYSTNYIDTIISLEPSNALNVRYENSLSTDNYPLKIERFIQDRISTETIYTYN